MRILGNDLVIIGMYRYRTKLGNEIISLKVLKFWTKSMYEYITIKCFSEFIIITNYQKGNSSKVTCLNFLHTYIHTYRLKCLKDW